MMACTGLKLTRRYIIMASKKKKTIGIQMDASLAKEIEARADNMGFSTSAYCKLLIKTHVKSGKKLTVSG